MLKNTAETRFNLVLAITQYSLKCIIGHYIDTVFTEHMLMSIFISVCVSTENKLDYNINYNFFPI